MEKTAITPTRAENYSEWYQEVIKAADLAENSPVRGCMVIKPWGYAIWENIQAILDKEFKRTGHQNAYFPLLIPLSYLEKEAKHVEGFAKECAVVTHSRLEANAEGKLVPTSPLEEPLVVRPTSETIIGEMFARWIQSYRDLPLKINQWANIVRWEMRTRLFLRTMEFLWQEGHTAHATEQEAIDETLQMLQVYADFAKNTLAIPVICGEKTESERFPGAVNTYCIETMMQDRKALQSGTSHFLGQNFSKSIGIQFASQSGKTEHAWTTSWGVSTRIIGGLIMVHSDDNGLVLPPKIAPVHVVILPMLQKDPESVLAYCKTLQSAIQRLTFDGKPIQVSIDDRDMRGGDKLWHWTKKGVPILLEIGPKEVAANAISYIQRTQSPKLRTSLSQNDFLATLPSILQSIQDILLARATAFRDAHTVTISSKQAFYDFFTPKNTAKPEIHGGFALTHWAGTPQLEEQLKHDLKVTIRCIPFDAPKTQGVCPFTGQATTQQVIFAKAY